MFLLFFFLVGLFSVGGLVGWFGLGWSGLVWLVFFSFAFFYFFFVIVLFCFVLFLVGRARYQLSGETEAHSCNPSCHRLLVHDITVPKSLYFTISRLVLFLPGHNISTKLSTELFKILYQ